MLFKRLFRAVFKSRHFQVQAQHYNHREITGNFDYGLLIQNRGLTRVPADVRPNIHFQPLTSKFHLKQVNETSSRLRLLTFLAACPSFPNLTVHSTEQKISSELKQKQSGILVPLHSSPSLPFISSSTVCTGSIIRLIVKQEDLTEPLAHLPLNYFNSTLSDVPLSGLQLNLKQNGLLVPSNSLLPYHPRSIPDSWLDDFEISLQSAHNQKACIDPTSGGTLHCVGLLIEKKYYQSNINLTFQHFKDLTKTAVSTNLHDIAIRSIPPTVLSTSSLCKPIRLVTLGPDRERAVRSSACNSGDITSLTGNNTSSVRSEEINPTRMDTNSDPAGSDQTETCSDSSKRVNSDTMDTSRTEQVVSEKPESENTTRPGTESTETDRQPNRTGENSEDSSKAPKSDKYGAADGAQVKGATCPSNNASSDSTIVSTLREESGSNNDVSKNSTSQKNASSGEFNNTELNSAASQEVISQSKFTNGDQKDTRSNSLASPKGTSQNEFAEGRQKDTRDSHEAAMDIDEDRVVDGDIVVVTGGCGFLGQHIVKLLQLKAPHVGEIRVLDLEPFEQKLDYEKNKPIKSIVGSVTNTETVLSALRGAHCVMHVAGLVSYGTHPDYEGMERVNVKGTLNVLNGCIHENVQRLIYCSTVDVVVGNEPIRDGDEYNTSVPDSFLFPGYPETKYHGERIVLGSLPERKNEGGKLQTVALRANVMYGELDPYYVLSGLKAAKQWKGILHPVGDGRAMFQQCYVGNTAWAFLCADTAMKADPTLTREVFYVPDNTPIQNSFNFMRPYLEARGYQLSEKHLPYKTLHMMLSVSESVLRAIEPIAKIDLPSQSYSLTYINTDLWFLGSKARKRLGFEPLFDPIEARQLSMVYYLSVDLDKEKPKEEKREGGDTTMKDPRIQE